MTGFYDKDRDEEVVVHKKHPKVSRDPAMAILAEAGVAVPKRSKGAKKSRGKTTRYNPRENW